MPQTGAIRTLRRGHRWTGEQTDAAQTSVVSKSLEISPPPV
jgi:hypothetical protein